MTIATADALVPELIRLWGEENELSRCPPGERHSAATVREARQRATYDYIKTLERGASFAAVESPVGVVLLLGLIDDAASSLESLVPEGANDAKAEDLRNTISRMTYTIVRWMEAAHGIDRAEGAGNLYLPARCDPFAPWSVEAERAA